MTRSLRFNATRTALAGAFVMTLAAGTAHADQIVAQRLFLQATTLTAQARGETDPARRAKLLERANQDLQTIVSVHGETPLAARLSKGEAVGGFDPRAFAKELAEARIAAPAPATQAAMPSSVAPKPGVAVPPPAQMAQPKAPSRHDLPVAEVDPRSTAGRILRDVVDTIETALAGDEDVVVAVSKPVTAVQKGEMVSIVFPGLTLTDVDSTLEVGDLVLDVTPKPDEHYAFSLALPGQITGYTEGVANERLTMKAEPVTGVWARPLGGVTRFYMNLRDIRVESLAPEPTLMMSIETLTAEQRSDVQGDRLSGDFHLQVRETLAHDNSSTQQVRIGGMTLTSRAHDLDLTDWRRLSDAMQTDPTGSNGAGSERLLEILAKGGWSRLGMDLTVNDVEISDGPKHLGGLGGFNLGFDLDGRSQNGAVFGVKLGMDRLRVEEVPYGELPPTMVPHSFVIETAVEGLPLQAMAADALKVSQAGEDAPGLDAVLLAAMMTAQPRLNITQVSTASQDVQASLSGALKVDPQSAVASTGTLLLKIAGLDQIKAYLDRQSKKDEELRQYIPMVVTLRGLGNDSRLGGSKAKEFKVVVAKDGNVTINGTPWQALLGQPQEQAKGKKKLQ